ncbi:MAG: HDOD domain-containing protein [Candidatus Eisenbacteria bacterium]|nr:HDOD domain-containing protein [Candidatus Eisenbacteria bacterium]
MPSQNLSKEELIQRVGELPPLPQTLMRVWQVVDNPAADSHTLAQAVSADPPLVANLLRIANSATYGRMRSVNSISDAITLLGFNVIKKMCMGIMVHVGLLSQDKGTSNFDRVLFWRHCVGTGLTAEILAEMLHLPLAPTTFSHGLLHDLGLLVLDRHLSHELEEILGVYEATEGDCTLFEIEQELLGLNHAQLGAELALQWGFPQSLVDVAANHHHPRITADTTMECIVHLACAMTDQQQLCRCDQAEAVFEDARRFLGLGHGQLHEARETMSRRLMPLAEAFSI